MSQVASSKCKKQECKKKHYIIKEIYLSNDRNPRDAEEELNLGRNSMILFELGILIYLVL